MAKIIESEGLSLDVVSGGELFTAYSAGFPMDRVYFHGNNKTPEEIDMALEYGVGFIVVDNPSELEMLDKTASSLSVRQKVLVRVSPGVAANTHQYIQTGQLDSKFGFPLYRDGAFQAVKRVLASKALAFEGLHCHIGSQIIDVSAFRTAAENMLSFAARIWTELKAPVNVSTYGGGFGIYYTSEDRRMLPEDFSAL